MSLLTGLPYKDRLGNDIYPDFRNMLQIERIAENPNMDGIEKTIASLKMFYGDDIPGDTTAAFMELLWFYYRGEDMPKGRKKIVRLFDFDEDSPYIIAAFLSSYAVDLTNADYHLHWWQFMNLFVALPDDTQMMKRMCDRNLDTSKMKGEQRRYYEARKKAVALKGKRKPQGETLQERREARQRRLDELYAEAQRNRAKEGGDTNASS